MELTAAAAATTARRDDGANATPAGGIATTPVSWQPTGDLGLREWAVLGRRLGIVGRGAGWWIGDWLRYGNARFGERYIRPSKITGYSRQTLMNMAYVASRFEPDRRRPNLSWSHHAELAALDPAEQERWLDRAEAERLSIPSLRRAIRAEQAEPRGRIDAAREEDEPPELVCPECGCHLERQRRGMLRLAPA